MQILLSREQRSVQEFEHFSLFQPSVKLYSILLFRWSIVTLKYSPNFALSLRSH